MQRFLVALVAIAGCSVLADDKSGARPTAVSVPSGPGSIEGLGESFEANLNSGSVRQKVSMKVPPGTGGLAPSLGLSYDSGFGNGAVGIGWSLGQSSVQIRTDKGLPKYDGTDTFLLDGAELVQVSAGVYRFKNEGRFLRVRRSGNHWEADTPDGSVLRFGVSPEARIESGGHTFSWALEVIVDRAGNQIVNTYTLDAGQNYLSRIDYNVRAGAAKNRVELDYETRSDPVVDYRTGFPVTTAKRLRAVRTYAQDTLVRSYRLDYQAPNGLSLLVGVTETGSDGVTSLPTVSFEYSKPPGTLQPAAMQGAPATVPGPTASDDDLIDLNGDGFPDALHAAASGHTVAYNQGGLRFSTPVSVTSSPTVALSAPTVQVADLDGDGFPDLIAKLGTTSGSFKYFPNTGKGRWGPSVTFTNSPAFAFEDPNVRILDFDHDGLTDVAQSVSTGLTLWRNKGDGTWEGPLAAPLPPGMSSLTFTDPRLKLADMNGDRLVDLVMVRSGSVTWWPHAGRGTFAAPISIGGAPDVGTTAEANLFLADLTGDGLTDLVWVDTDHVDYWPLTPAGVFGTKVTIASTPHRDPTVTTVRFADMNGNGSADIVWSTPTAAVNQRVVYLDVVGDVRPNLLTRVQNGLGKDLKLGYTNSGFEAQLAQAAGIPWTRSLPFSVQMLASTKLSDGLGHLLVTAFSYRDPWFAPSTREFRGFAHAERRALGDSDSPDSVDAHDFDLGETDETLKGRELLLETRTPSGYVFSRVTTTWDVATYAMGLDGTTAIAGARVRMRLTERLEGLTTPITIKETSDYDAYGNVTVSHQFGAKGTPHPRGGRDGSISTTTYSVNEDRWLLRFPASIVVTDESGAKLSESDFYYDGPAFQGLPLGQVNSGFVTRKSAWISDAHFVDLERNAFDDYGNIVRVKRPNGLERTTTFDSTHTFAISEQVGGPNGDLVWRASHDPGTGNTLSATDQTGAVSSAAYDALGRVVAIARPGDTLGLPTETYDYTLSSPASTLTTRSRLDHDGSQTSITISWHDGLGRKLRTAKRIGDSWLVSGAAEYTLLGQTRRQFHAFLADAGNSAPPPDAAFESFVYDAAGRIVGHTRSNGTQLRNVIRPFERDEYDADDTVPGAAPLFRTLRTNRRDQPYEVIDRIRDDDGGIREALWALDFDGLGHPTSVVDPVGHTRRLSYDGLGRLVRIDDPDVGVRTYQYDDEGNLLLLTTELGTVETTYDVLNRRQTTTARGPAGVQQASFSFHYDVSPDGWGQGNYVGRLGWVEDDSGKEEYSYDDRGNVVAQRREIAGKTFEVRFVYDTAERLSSVRYPDGQVLPISTDSLGRTTALQGLVDTVRYEPSGAIRSIEFANGVNETRDYDSLDRLIHFAVGGHGKSIRDATMRYDGRSNLLEVADFVAPELSAQYDYDSVSRLVAARLGTGTSQTAWRYAYDDDGNFSAVNGEVAAFGSSRPHALTALGGRSFVYGPGGALTSWNGRKAIFDAFGRVRQVDTKGGTETLTYDFNGRLLIDDGPGGRREFPSRYQEGDSSGMWNVAYLGSTRLARFRFASDPGGGCDSAVSTPVLFAVAFVFFAAHKRRRLALRFLGLTGLILVDCGRTNQIGKVVFLHHDGVGSTTFTTDEHGVASKFVVYSPFGSPSANDIGERQLFSGRYTSSELGLTLWPTRALATDLGRWNLPDVDALENPKDHLLSPQGLNPYTYAGDNPVTFLDVGGAFEEPIHGALTYHLAIKAGFTESEAVQISLSCAGVDHNPQTAPTAGLSTVHNLSSGITAYYHFADPPVALARVEGQIAKGSKMDLNKLGVALHTLEDVGFTDALGPHMRGAPADGLIKVISDGNAGGHPTYRMQDGTLSDWTEHYADQPFRDHDANVKELNRIFNVLTRAAQSLHPGAKADAAGARSLINNVVSIDSAKGISSFLDRTPTGPMGGEAGRSYSNQVMLNYVFRGSDADGVYWKPDDIDSSVGK